MPKLTFASKDAIPEGLGEFATEDNGKYVVEVSPTTKLNEFRDNNVKYLRERDEAVAKLTTYTKTFGEDIAAVSAELTDLRATSQLVKDGKLKASGDIATEVENRTKAAREAYEAQAREASQREQALKSERDAFANKYRASVRDSAISAAVLAADSGVNPQALADVMRRAGDVFHVEEDGKLVPKKDGVVVYSADGSGGPMTVKEWMGSLLKEAPYLGKASAGGGSGPNGGEKRGGMPKEQFDKLAPVERLNSHWGQKQGS